ncbi:MAG: ABC transporter substrate-binding protein [Propionibacteriales bacterium]|nr:ABC transporter substrate-binding protein [Propionibacteriales bacterium]
MFLARNIRVAAVAGSLAALMAVSACGGGDTGTGAQPSGDKPSDNPAMAEKGPITFVTGKDTSGNLQSEVDEWNKANVGQEVKIIELPDNADQQRAAMIQNAESKGTEYTVLNVDVVWTAEFAANGYIEELPTDKFDFSGFLPVTVESAKYFNKLYAVPVTSDGGLLYYRSDWLKAAGITAPPTTYEEMKAACATIKEKVPGAKGADCYAGQHDKYEGLTVNVSEAIDSAGGHITDDQGAATANTPEAVKGLTWMADAFADGTIPKAALTWKEEESRTAFQSGKLIFHRNWPYIYALASKDDGSSKINGKFEVAPLPGVSGPGVSSLGGHNYAISKTAKNKGTAIEFMKWMSSEERMVARTEATSNAPTRTSLYTDAALTKKFPYLPVLQKSIEGARPRPKVVKYGDVTLAIQDAAYATLQGQKEPQAAMDELQSKLEPLVKK